MSKPWLPHEINELLHLREAKGLTWEAIAKRIGRTRGACKDKYRDKGNTLPKDAPRMESNDETYVGMCLAEGGFCWLSERPLGQGNYAVCLPLNWPTMRRAA